MASTNPLHRANKDPRADDAVDTPLVRTGRLRRRGAGAPAYSERRKSRNKLRQMREMAATTRVSAGWPEFNSLKPVLSFLAIPACLVLVITLTGGHWPSFILYPIALGLGLFVAASTLRGVELVLAVLLIYLPLSKVFVVPIAPGVNGTNMLLILGFFAATLRLLTTRRKLTEWPAGTYLVFAFGFLTSLSAFTLMLIPGGRVYLLYSEILSYKAWIDQFVFYFIVLMCVRDIETAKRCAVYVMIGSVLVVLYSVPEMLEKSGRSTIDKSRIGGPHLQSNNFGGFVAYTILPLIALFISYIKDVRAWLLTPYFLLTAKVLISTFSRGAYLAMVVGGLLAGWFKGRGFIAWWLAIALSFFLVFPSLIPTSIVARMDTFTEDANSAASAEDRLDQSSAIRLIMWRAAATMIVEDPVWGKGFKGFPFLKDDYINVDIKESDPHSMYFYIGSQMGLPSLSLFLVILGYSFWLGRTLSLNKEDKFIRVIGIGGAASTACFAVVCIFGSRAVSLNFTVYFWAFFVIMQVIRHQQQLAMKAAAKPKPVRTFAIDLARQESKKLRAMDSDEDQFRQPTSKDDRSGIKHKANSRALEGEGDQRSFLRRPGPSRGAEFHQAEEREVQVVHPWENPTDRSTAAPEPDLLTESGSPRLRRKSRRSKRKLQE
ncbi:MAG: O-antigen ligase family protein [Granulosicoccus sp.]